MSELGQESGFVRKRGDSQDTEELASDVFSVQPTLTCAVRMTNRR